MQSCFDKLSKAGDALKDIGVQLRKTGVSWGAIAYEVADRFYEYCSESELDDAEQVVSRGEKTNASGNQGCSKLDNDEHAQVIVYAERLEAAYELHSEALTQVKEFVDRVTPPGNEQFRGH